MIASKTKECSSIVISASSGRELIKISLYEKGSDYNSVSSKCELMGRFWNEGSDSNDEEDDYLLTLHQALFSIDKLIELLKCLRLWLDEYHEFSIDLSADPYQVMSLEFAQIPELICQKDKPALRLRYKGKSSMSIDVVFLIDQTCVQQVIDDLEYWISKNGIPPKS